jgi:acetoacetyl-CoA synthetase
MLQPLWTPSPEQMAQTNMMHFMADVNQMHHLHLHDYDSLYDWSVANIPAFWEAVWRFAGIIHSAPFRSVLDNPVMPGAIWYDRAR